MMHTTRMLEDKNDVESAVESYLLGLENWDFAMCNLTSFTPSADILPNHNSTRAASISAARLAVVRISMFDYYDSSWRAARDA